MRKRDYLHKVAIGSGLSADWDAYKILRNEVNSNICSAKEKYYKRKNKSPANTVEINGQICSIPAVISNQFNDYLPPLPLNYAVFFPIDKSHPSQVIIVNLSSKI